MIRANGDDPAAMVHSPTQWLFLHLPGWILAGYVTSLVFILIYSFSQAHLIGHYVRSRRNIRPVPKARLTDALPFVTVQLPVYNEKYVVARLLEAVAACVTLVTGWRSRCSTTPRTRPPRSLPRK
jgi:hypothetical protein